MKPSTERSFRWLLCALALLGVSADQASKYGVFHWLRQAGDEQGVYESSSGELVRSYKRDVIPGGFELLAQYTNHPEPAGPARTWLQRMGETETPKVNKGALFGLGGDYGHLANQVFATVSIAAAVAILYWSTRRTTAHDRILCAALGLILAGTIGNFYDRLVFHGVRDFLHYFYLFEWPVFNVADCCLVCGAGLLLLQAFLARPASPGHAAQAPATGKGRLGVTLAPH